MSVRAIGSVFRHSQSRGVVRLVLLAMADEANDQGLLTAYQRSFSHLARKAQCARSSVQRAVEELVEMGEIEVLATGRGHKKSDYRLLLPDLDPVEKETKAEPVCTDDGYTEPEQGTTDHRYTEDSPSVHGVPTIGTQGADSGASITPFVPDALPVLARKATSLDFVPQPDHPVTIAQRVGAILNAVARRSTENLTSREVATLRAWLPDALRNGHDDGALVEAILACSWRTETAVLGELRQQRKPRAQSVGDKNITAGLRWLEEGA